jgi:hypothetical protein
VTKVKAANDPSRKRKRGPTAYVGTVKTGPSLRIRYLDSSEFPWLLELAKPDMPRGLAIASFQTEQQAELGHRILADALLHLEEFL